MPFDERESLGSAINAKPIGSFDGKNDVVVITPPPSNFTEIDTQLNRPSKNRKGIWRFPSHNETSPADIPAVVRRKSNSMPSSRSLGNLAVMNEGTASAEKPQLQLPKAINRTSSVHEKDRQRHLSDEKPRSRTPQPVRKIFARTRSSSPHSIKQNGSWTLPRDAKMDTDTESPWSKTMKFLGRKAPTSPFSLNIGKSKESQATNLHTQGITELRENTETTGSSSPADPVQFDVADVSGQAGGTVIAGSSGASNEMGGDVPDGPFQSNAAQREHLRQKIMKISEQIKIEQGVRDDNVAEYLRLSHTADKQQAVRMKSVFEKKNLKSKAAVAQLQKKLDNYHRRLKELDSNGKTLGGKFKDVQAKLTDISGGVASSVQGIITNKLGKTTSKKFPSVDNIPSSLNNETHGVEEMERSNSLDNVSAATSESGEISAAEYPHSTHSLPPRPSSPILNVAQWQDQLITIQGQMEKITNLEAQCKIMEVELESFKTNVKQNIATFKEHLGRTSDQYSNVSGQMQDLTELHRREMDYVKQDLASLEEKLEYHAQERARDIQEALEACQTRISKMEVQQQHQHQQLVTMEGVENATAKALVGKLINLLLSVLAVLLVFVSTVSSILMPFVRNQTRIIATGVCILLVALLYRNWTPLTATLTESWWWLR